MGTPNAQVAPLEPGVHRSCMQRLWAQAVPGGHVSDEPPPQKVLPPSSPTHEPPAQRADVVHAVPQVPQCVELEVTSMHAPPQHWPLMPEPRGQVTPSFPSEQVGIGAQLPFEQNWFAGHARPQAPQCCGLVRTSEQVFAPQQRPLKLLQSCPVLAPVQSVGTQVLWTQVEPDGQLSAQLTNEPASLAQKPRLQFVPDGQVSPHCPQLALVS